MPVTVKRVLSFLAALVFFLAMGAIAVVLYSRMSWKGLLGVLVLLVSMGALVALGWKFQAVDRAIFLFFGGLIWFCLWVIVITAPVGLFFRLSQFILFKRALAFQIVTLLAWALILIFALLLIATRKTRGRLFGVLKGAGRFAPLIYSFEVLIIAVIFFASVTYVLADYGLVNVNIPSPNGAPLHPLKVHSVLLDFYMWHFLDAIPLLKINQTLRWPEPLTNGSARIGLILLLFKITVIIPVIAAFTGYWKYEDNRIRLADHVLKPGKGSESGLHVTFFGVSTLLFEDGETAFMVDGFFTRPGKLRTLFTKIKPNTDLISQYLKEAEIKTLAAVIVAHSHYDHALDAPEVAWQTNARLIGSESTARIGRASRPQLDCIEVIKDGETKKIGNFEITFIPSLHSPMTLLKRFGLDHVLLEGNVSDQFKSPARWDDYREGGSYSFMINHNSKKILVQSSAGYIPDALKGQQADIVFLGIGTLGRQSEEYRSAYWREIVEAVGARRVIPIHWDDFSQPLDQPLVPASPLVDDVQESLAFLLTRGKKAKVDVKILQERKKSDPFAGLKKYQGKPKKRET